MTLASADYKPVSDKYVRPRIVILGWKCTLAASRAAPGEPRWVCAARRITVRKNDGTDGRTDARPMH